MNLEHDIKKLSLAFAIAMLETHIRVHLTRTLVWSSAAIACRAFNLDALLVASLTLASREFVPGCVTLLKVRTLRRAFGNVDCG